MLGKRVCSLVEQDAAEDALLWPPRSHLVVVGVEAAHQLTTIRLLLLLKLAEGRREREEENEEGRGAPAPHGRSLRGGQVCARGGRGLDCARAHRLDWSPPVLTYNTPPLVCMSTGL